jgi:hypothetical protein
MQVEPAQAATLVVNNLNDSGIGSLRDTINIANSNDVVEFLLGNHPSTITLTSEGLAIAKDLTINGPGANLLTITSNNQFPVFEISAANVTLSGFAIAGNINAYNSSSLTFTNSTINGNSGQISSGSKNSGTAGTLTITTSTLRVRPGAIISKPVTEASAIANDSNNSGAAGSIRVTASDVVLETIVPEPSAIAADSNNSGAGGNITLTVNDLFLLRRVPEPSAIAADSNNSGAGGNITLTTSTILLRRVPEASAIAGSLLAGSLAWLVKRKQATFRKAKV